MIPTPDIQSTREKYALERERRLRKEGVNQYAYADDQKDPFAEPIERGPLSDHTDAIVIGGGIGGLSTAVRLKQAGLERVRVIDRAGDFGGTWYWNRYPGAQSDVESYIYLPLIEERGDGYIPSEKYAHQPEILEHCQTLAAKWGLYDDALFQTEVDELVWDEDARRWTVKTDRGDNITGQFVVLAAGFLARPKLPDIPGFDEFEGKVFHTSRWDYDYTGGGPGPNGGGLPKLADKRVGIVGTGATALQCVAPVGEHAKELFVFQRTPAVVFERNNKPTDPEWAASLKPGWQAERMEAFGKYTSGFPVEDVVQDGWTQRIRPVSVAYAAELYGGEAEREYSEQIDFATMQYVHQRVSEIVRDPATAEALKAQYRIMCKRASFHDKYLQTFNRDNVTLVDTAGRGIERLTSKGVVAGGETYELDCLVFATGFDTGRDFTTSVNIDAIGRNEVRLSEEWSAGMKTFHGFHSNGFPNLFFVGLFQGATGINFAHSLTGQANYLGRLVAALSKDGKCVVEAKKQDQEAWVETVKAATPPGYTTYLRACTPSYFNNEGSVDDDHRFGSTNYWGGQIAFLELLDKWLEAGDYEGLEVS